ncbi:MAG: sulfite exporter TauE/SafE family protein [Pseudolabrys sp.]|nr:sulfite exporter TauE/SafE family protein [Pseudolabrys sp.]
MDSLVLPLFLVATLAGGIVTGLAGFAFGLAVSGVWLHILTPLQTTLLIISFGTVVQVYGTWKMRHSFNWRHVVPILIGSVIGVPIGVWLLAYMNPSWIRLGVGLLLVLYSLNGLFRPHLTPIPANVPAEVALGVVNGMLGGMTGLAGVFVTIWCGMRGWSKDQQRSVFQPVILGSFLLTWTSLAVSGKISGDTIRLFLYGLPLLLAGMWVGFELYGRLDDAGFRKVVLVLLLISGIVLVVPELFSLR